MVWNIVTLFPEAVRNLLGFGLLGQAFEKKILQLNLYNPRDGASDNHKTVDDRPFGGGDGMVMQAEILDRALLAVQAQNPESRFIYLSPQGRTLNESLVQELSQCKNITLVCGRYGGIDQRVINKWRLQEVSIGDYVISGGEVAAGVLIDVVSRKISGVLGHGESAQCDSHADGWLEAPMMTRPRVWQGQEVPEFLLSGHHEKIQQWRKALGILVTIQKRPDLLKFMSKQRDLTDLPTDLPIDLSSIDLSVVCSLWDKLSEADRRVLGLDPIQIEKVLGRGK